MKPSRQFRPLAHDALEGRIAPSQIAVGVPHTAKAHQQPPAHVRAGGRASSKAAFPMNIADTIAAGSPVEEIRTTRFAGGATQTETRLIQPDAVNNSTLTTQTIHLRNNGGTETVSDFSYASMMNTTVHAITTTLPDGTVQIKNETRQTVGDTTEFSATVKLPNNAGVQTTIGTSVDRGPVTIVDETVSAPDGTSHHDRTVIVHRGELNESSTETDTAPNGTRQVTRSSTTIVRVQPPDSASLGTLNPGVKATTPKIT